MRDGFSVHFQQPRGLAMKKLNPVLISWLCAWGDWRRTDLIGLPGLGYPDMTQEAKLTCSPGRTSYGKRIVNYWPDPLARQVDKAIKEVDPHEYQVLMWWRYCQEAGPTRIGEYLGVSKEKARWELEKAHIETAKGLKIRVYA